MKTIKNLLLSAAVALCGSILPAGAQTDAGTTTADVPMVRLNNGVLMPRFGQGMFLQGSDEVCRQSCLTALKAGYRHIDTAGPTIMKIAEAHGIYIVRDASGSRKVLR